MNIVLFEDITTEDALQAIEADSEKYVGLYVDMDNAPERKYVKDKASEIQVILKALDRARIDKSKAYKLKVEKEAQSIRERLEHANTPFTLLIDQHKKKRADILAEEKRVADAKALAIQIENDHEFALLMDEQVMLEKHLAEENRIKYETQLKEEAAAKALEREAERQRQENIERQVDIKNVSAKRTEAKNGLMKFVSEAVARDIVMAIHCGAIDNVSIQY